MSWHPAWTLEHESVLIDLVGSGFSFRQSAVALNEQFGTKYTRNSTIGKAHRIGLSAIDKPRPPRQPKKQQPYKPRPKRQPMFVQIREYVELECSEIIPGHVDIVACNGCRWAYGDGPFTFCNRRQLNDSSYCPGHYRLSIRSGNYTESDRQRRSLQIQKLTQSRFAPETMEPIA